MHCINCGKENEEGSQFCMYCGTQLYKPDDSHSEVTDGEPIQPEHVIQESKSSKEKKTKRGSSKKEKLITGSLAEKIKKIPRRKLVILLGAVGGLLVVAICFLLNIAFWGSRLYSAPEQLIYSIQENINDNVTVFMSISENGKNNKELYSDNDGFSSVALALDYFPWLKNRMFSPNGKTMAVVENNGDLLLLDRDSSLPISVDINENYGVAGLGHLQGFSPNGQYIGFTDVENSSLVTVILDLQGNEIYSIEDMILGSFLPDNRRVVVIETDRENLVGLGILDFLSGDYTFLTGLEENDASRTFWYSTISPMIVSPSGDTIYYIDGKNLMSIPTKGGSSSLVYESDEGINYSFFSPDNRTMAIADRDGNNLYIYDTARGNRSRITNDVENIKFSSNGRYLAYVTNEGTNEKDLYVSKSDGSDKVRLTRNVAWLKFQFSPNNRLIAYIDGNTNNDGGSLYVVRNDGSDSTRLDTGVWSFRFVDGGNSIVYIKVNDLDRGNPESEIYRIRINGRNKERLLQADDGLYNFIWPVP